MLVGSMLVIVVSDLQAQYQFCFLPKVLVYYWFMAVSKCEVVRRRFINIKLINNLCLVFGCLFNRDWYSDLIANFFIQIALESMFLLPSCLGYDSEINRQLLSLGVSLCLNFELEANPCVANIKRHAIHEKPTFVPPQLRYC